MKALIPVLMVAILSAPLAQAQAVRVVTEATSYSFLKDGKMAGPATEVVELSLKRAGLVDYQINLYPWARSYDMALKEPNVLIYLIARTPAREPQFKWAGEIMKMQYHLYKLKDRNVMVRNLEDARNFTIGVMRDDVRHQYLKEKGFTRLVVSAQPADNFRKLLSGQVDIVPLPDDDAASMCKETNFSCENLQKIFTLDEMSTGLYMAYSNSTPDAVVQRTKDAFEKIRAAGIVKSIMEKRR
ncbi:substrate-binding periplasmic protein [Rhodoferax ferrireducens]|uniref:substrate-binding periplasmic protein n=1 Tax=Rhodoferax ferrireducens TaxID=192843 RepID=UPI000E0DA973|nr:transporter substrate-binding domain-containing protein [Rhodoferax ferrireducens]